MTAELLSLILDFVILVALVGTIYYAFNLTRSLKNFQRQREEMRVMITDLVRNIDDAQTAIDGLKAASHIAADNLDDVLHESKKMAEELRIINDTSNSLANRLEGLAAGRNIAQKVYDEEDSYGGDRFDDFEDEEDTAPSKDVIEPPSFFIQDRDFESDDDFEDDADLSRAERELLQALQGQKQGRGGR